MTSPLLRLFVLKTNQIESVREFYSLIGFEFKEERHGTGPTHYSAALEGGIFEIYPLKNGTPDNTTRLGFGVGDISKVINSLESSASIVALPKQTPWGTRAVIRDPDGRSVEIYESG